MNNLNEKEQFDSLFKSASIDYELPFNEAAWQLMEHKLDTEQAKKKRGGLFWWLPVMAIVVSGSIYFIVKINFSKNSQINDKEIVVNLDKNINKEKIENNIGENIPITENNPANKLAKNNAAAKTKNKNFVIDENNVTTKNNQNFIAISNSKTKPNTPITKKSSNTVKPLSNTSNIKKENDIINGNASNSIPKNASTSSIPLAASNNKSNTNNKIDIIERMTADNAVTRFYTANISLMHNRYISNFKQLELANLLVVAEREEAAKEAAKKAAELAKNGYILPYARKLPSTNWYITASVANNIGYVSNPRIDESSLQYQIGVGYNLSRNASIQTGIAFGTRGFGMRKDQFTYKGDLALEKQIKYIYGNISVIDIPVTFRYQLSDRENFGWFGTIGISTVFLKKEHYRLTLDNGSTISYLDQNFENTTSKSSMLNLSIGYQFPLSKGFTLTAEPYIQLPFKMIGEGGMKMSSIGLQIGGRYNFPKKRK